MDWHTATSPEIHAMREHQVAILPTGSLERHGDHLPTGVDGLIAQGVARRAAEREPCMVLPPIYYAVQAPGRNATGLVAVPVPLLLQQLERICDDVAHNGFKKIVILNGHGGNMETLGVFLREIADKGKDYAVYVTSAWLDRDIIAKVRETEIFGHGGEIETSAALYLFPELVKTGAIPESLSESLLDYDVSPARTQLDWYARFPDQYQGDARAATPEKGKRLIDTQVDALADLLQRIKADTRVAELLEQYRHDMTNPRATADELSHGRRSKEGN